MIRKMQKKKKTHNDAPKINDAGQHRTCTSSFLAQIVASAGNTKSIAFQSLLDTSVFSGAHTRQLEDAENGSGSQGVHFSIVELIFESLFLRVVSVVFLCGSVFASLSHLPHPPFRRFYYYGTQFYVGFY